MNIMVPMRVCAGVCLLSIYGACAHSVLARNEDRFYKTVERTPLAIALFYQDHRVIRREDPEGAEQMARAERLFEYVANARSYKEGGLCFIKASILRSDMNDMASSFGITRVPACVLFKDGALVRDAAGKPVILQSIDSQGSIVRFIRTYLRHDLRKNQREYDRRQELRAMYGPRVSVGVGVGYPYWGYYDPYDYYPWYYYGGGWPCGVGLGCGVSFPCGCRSRGCCSRGCHR